MNNFTERIKTLTKWIFDDNKEFLLKKKKVSVIYTKWGVSPTVWMVLNTTILSLSPKDKILRSFMD